MYTNNEHVESEIQNKYHLQLLTKKTHVNLIEHVRTFMPKTTKYPCKKIKNVNKWREHINDMFTE